DQFQLELEVAFLSFGSRLGVARGLIGGGSEMPIATATLSGLRDDDALTRLVEIGDEDLVVGVVDLRAGRDKDDQIFGAFAVDFFSHAGLALFGVPVMPAGEIEQRIFIRIGEHDDGSAIAPVTAVGPALGDIF